MSKRAAKENDLLQDPGFSEVKRLVIAKTGLSYYEDKDAELARILAARMQACRQDKCASYAALLERAEGQAEQDELISELTIGETYFFRHPEVFDALKRHVVPEILARNAPTRRLKIWSAGCSTGAEPYSIAILLKREFEFALAGWQGSVIGTDIDRRSLAQAESGLYQDWVLRATPEPERGQYFERTPSGWRLKPRYREAVRFQGHNLIADPLPAPDIGLCDIDVILCRNVAIYFSRDQIQRLMARFHDCLNEGGWLLTGPAEIGMDRPDGFVPVNLDGLIVYRKDQTQALPDCHVWIPPELPPPAPEAFDLLVNPLVQPQAAEIAEATAEMADKETTQLEDLAERGQWLAALGPARHILARPDAGLDLALKAVQVLIEAGDFDGADRALKRLLFVDRKCLMAYYHQGILLTCRGDRKMAAKAFRNARDLAAVLPPDTLLPGGEGLRAGQLAAMAALRARVETAA